MSPSEDATEPSRPSGAAVLDPAEENGCLEAARRALRSGTRGVEEDLGVVSDRLRQRDADADDREQPRGIAGEVVDAAPVDGRGLATRLGGRYVDGAI